MILSVGGSRPDPLLRKSHSGEKALTEFGSNFEPIGTANVANLLQSSGKQRPTASDCMSDDSLNTVQNCAALET